MDYSDVNQDTFEKIFKEHLKIETYSKSIDSLFSYRSKSKIDYSPYYQRNYVWDKNKATFFIESILMGTEVPPLIFFNNNKGIEIIDGRQRYETILRFMEDKFSLTIKGLAVLKGYKKCNFTDLKVKDSSIIDCFLDAKIRIIEFKLVNHPPLDKYLEDRIKKEIFSRYNSGITPLKKAEIDNAVYDNDGLSNMFKDYFKKNNDFTVNVYSTFLKQKTKSGMDLPIEDILSFLRKNISLPFLPINYYARSGKNDTLVKLYEKISDDSVDQENKVMEYFFNKLNFLIRVKKHSELYSLKNNRLALECFLWGLGVIDLEEKTIDLLDEKESEEIARYIDDNIDFYSEIDSNFSKAIITRYETTAKYFERKFNISLNVFVNANQIKRDQIKELKKDKDNSNRLNELETLRLNKPEPSRNSIEDITRTMQRRKFLVRPSYQRKEVVNVSKASAIIESVILGISLPAIFIFKRSDGTSEVIDGQQRILTLLGFIGAEYIDENEKLSFSKNNNFSLRNMRILKDLERKKYQDLSEELKNKILDFQLYVVEIDHNQNPNFNPIDLFIRLNDKPYPIREHSFEMWNSWVDIDITQQIKDCATKSKEWFYIKKINSPNDRDRMENEELIVSMAYLEYMFQHEKEKKYLDIYQKTERINSRIIDKSHISSVLQVSTEKEDEKKKFSESIKKFNNFLKKLRFILLDKNLETESLEKYLSKEMDHIFKAGKASRNFRRRKQDFYIIWYLLSEVNLEMVKFHRLKMKEEIKQIYIYMKNIPTEMQNDNLGFNEFVNICEDFKNRYLPDERKLRLSQEEKNELLKKQVSISPVSGAPIFIGDEVEADHKIPLANGGKDELGNIQVIHKDENRKKGTKRY